MMFADVAQLGLSAGLITQRTLVQIQPSAFTMIRNHGKNKKLEEFNIDDPLDDMEITDKIKLRRKQ